MPDLLLELGTEELPARFLDRLLKPNEPKGLAQVVRASLTAAGLPPAVLKVAGTPRRLTVWAGGLPDQSPPVSEEKWGPASQAAFKDGAPTMAATKFAESCGVAVDALEKREKKKGKKSREHLYFLKQEPGRPTLELLTELIPAWIEALHFAKSMRWVPHSKLRFGRPLRRITALLGDAQGAEVVPTGWADVTSGRQIEGHRFLDRTLLTLADASWDTYVQVLKEHKVVLDAAERRSKIEAELEPHLGPAGLTRYAALVTEVSNLVEWPATDVGSFEARFLQLPDVVIDSAMTNHQRYFPIRKDGKLLAKFAYVANRPLHPVIREGNERVLRARLADALFFFDLDQKKPLSERLDSLAPIVFMDGLGSYLDRIPRIADLALLAAKAAGWVDEAAALPTSGTKITRALGKWGPLPEQIYRAALLGRTDLGTEVVGEFPELQGEIGSIYARMQGESDEVATAIREAYLPRGEGDELPQTQVGQCLALAEKLDLIVAAWATGKKPTGSKDPFQVRRSVIGVLRILREQGLDLGLARLIDAAVFALPKQLRTPTLATEITDYFRDRLEVMAKKNEGRDVDRTRQALHAGSDSSNVVDFWLRLDALDELAQDERFGPLCELVLRTRNITDKNGADVDPLDVDAARLEHAAEKALAAAIEAARGPIQTAIAERRYVEAGKHYVDALAQTVHTFFEPAPTGVFVMDEDLRLRTNRLALLKQVRNLLADGFADLSQRG